MFGNGAKDPASVGGSRAYTYILGVSLVCKKNVFKINGQRIDSIHLNLHGSINDTRLNAAKCSYSEDCYFPKTSQQSTPYKPVELEMEMVAELENVLRLIESVDILI